MKIRRMFFQIFLVIAFSSIIVFGQSEEAKKIDDYIDPFVKAGHFAGVVLASKDGKIIYEKAFGYANAELKVLNQPNTRIGIASITKPMTSVILIRLIEQNKIALTDKLNKFIPDFPNGDKITIEMLARHRSGIPHRVMPPEMEAVAYTSAEMIENVKKAKLEFEPGGDSLYSSAGFSVLARCLEIASGKNYQELLEEFVFNPAGMQDSLDFNGEMIMQRRAQDYLLDKNGYFNAPLKDYSFLVGAGSVFSTALDIHKFGEAFHNGAYSEIAKMNFVRDGVFQSNGSTNGHRSFVKINASKKYGYVLLANLSTGASDLILQALEKILEGKNVEKPIIPQPTFLPKPTQTAEFLGRYKTSNNRSFEVTAKNNILYAGDRKLIPTKTDCFYDFKSYGEVCFKRDGNTRITEMIWATQDGTSKWTKQ